MGTGAGKGDSMPRTPTGAARVASSLPWPALLRAALALLLVGLLLWTVDWRGSLARLMSATPLWVLAAAALVAACVLVSAWKWQLLLRARGLHAGLPALVRLYWIGIFFTRIPQMDRADSPERRGNAG